MSIFTTETILKSNIYQRIKDLLVANGWTNISSKPSTDFDVFYSKGVAEDKELYFQLQDPGGMFTTGTQAALNIKMINKYTPGAPGNAGTFDSNRGNEAWRPMYLFTSGSYVYGPDIPIKFSYHVNADRIIFATELPLALNTLVGDNITYIGALSLYGSEPNCRSLVAAQAAYSTLFSGFGSLVITSTPYSDYVASYSTAVYRINTLTEYNNNDIRMLSEIGVGNATDGLRGKLDGLYCLYTNSNPRTVSGDILTDGTNTYRVISVSGMGGAAKLFPDTNTLYAIQVS